MRNLTKPDNSRQVEPKLSIEQENAIDLLIQGKSDREVAEATGVTRQTVCDWRNHNAAFIAELNSQRSGLWGSHLDRLRELLGGAIGVLEEDLTMRFYSNDDRKIRQAAAVHILKASGLYGENLQPVGETSEEGVSREQRRKEINDLLGSPF